MPCAIRLKVINYGMKEEKFFLLAAYHVIPEKEEKVRNCTFCGDNIATSDAQIPSFMCFYCCMRYKEGKN